MSTPPYDCATTVPAPRVPPREHLFKITSRGRQVSGLGGWCITPARAGARLGGGAGGKSGSKRGPGVALHDVMDLPRRRTGEHAAVDPTPGKCAHSWH